MMRRARAQTPKTPQQPVKTTKTSSIPVRIRPIEKFPDGLEHKQKRFGVPVTSTPVPNKFKSAREKDIRTCFGFDESDDENDYSALMSPIAIEDPVTRIPGLDAALKRKNNAKNVKKVDDVQVLQENNSKSPDFTSNNKEKVDLASTEENGNKSAQPIQKDVEVGTVEVNKAPDPEKEKSTDPDKEKPTDPDREKPTNPDKEKPKVGRGVRKGQAKNVAPRKQPTRNAKNSLHPTKLTSRKQAQELYHVDDFEASQRLSQDLRDDPQSAAPCSDVYIKTGHPGDGFNAFLARYGKADEESDEELHVDTEKLIRTYSSHTCSRSKAIPLKPSLKKRRNPRATKSNRHAKTVTVQDESGSSDEDQDPAMKKWLEEKNKEFEDVLHVPLVVTGEVPRKSKRKVTTTRRTKT